MLIMLITNTLCDAKNLQFDSFSDRKKNARKSKSITLINCVSYFTQFEKKKLHSLN